MSKSPLLKLLSSVFIILLINTLSAQIPTSKLFKAYIYDSTLVPPNIGFAYSIMDVAEAEFLAKGEKIYGAEFGMSRAGVVKIKNGLVVPAFNLIPSLDKNGFYNSFNLGFFPIGKNYFATFTKSLDILNNKFDLIFSIPNSRIPKMTGRDLNWDPHGFGESIIDGKYIVIGMEEKITATQQDVAVNTRIIAGKTTIVYPAAIVYDLKRDTVVSSFYFSDHKKEFPLSAVHTEALADTTSVGPEEYDGFHINEVSFDPSTSSIDKHRFEVLFCLRNYKTGLVLVDLFSNKVIAQIDDKRLAAPHGGLIKSLNDSIKLIAIHNNGYLNNGKAMPISLDIYRVNTRSKAFTKISSKAIPEYKWSQRVGQYLPWRGDYYKGLKGYTWVTVGGNFKGPPRFINKDQALRGILYYHDTIRVMDISVIDTVFKKGGYHTSLSTIVHQMHPIIWDDPLTISCGKSDTVVGNSAYPTGPSLRKKAKWYCDGRYAGTGNIPQPFSDLAVYYYTIPGNYKTGVRYSEYLTGAELNTKLLSIH